MFTTRLVSLSDLFIQKLIPNPSKFRSKYAIASTPRTFDIFQFFERKIWKMFFQNFRFSFLDPVARYTAENVIDVIRKPHLAPIVYGLRNL